MAAHRRELTGTCRAASGRWADVIAGQQAVALAGLELDAVAQVAAEQAMHLTGAEGAVVELVEGDELVYRAVAGTAAPHLGVRLTVVGSLSGAAVRLDEVLVCADSETDPGVD